MNSTETPSIQNPRKFLSVILAGLGNELQPLTSNYSDQPCPKALLPIGNKPMISYVLKWVEEMGLEALSLSSLNVEIQTFDQAQDIPAGTTNVLAHFASRITSDLVLLPCDFLSPPSLRLETVLNKSKIEAGTDGVLVTALFFENKASENEKGTGAAKEAWPAPSVPMPILYDLASDELELRMSMLWQYPRTKFTTRVVDVLMYVCKHAVLDALQLKKAHLDPIREECIPWLCNNSVWNPITNTPANSLALQHSTSYHPSSHKSKVVSRVESLMSSLSMNDEEGRGAADLADGYAASVNNVHTYLGTEGPPIARARHALVDMKSTVSPDSLVGVSTRVGERSTLKRSVVGCHCVIGKRHKARRMRTHEYCVVEEQLVRCTTQPGCEVEPGGVYKHELFRCLEPTSPFYGGSGSRNCE
ncbi:UDP-3-O-glucosamine N-acyltransferase [Phellopilus nigrolimitatus]|nr:UDP-3-O-glucosamine N-acyltransferase [Phellopilus nigrolimitatus]